MLEEMRMADTEEEKLRLYDMHVAQKLIDGGFSDRKQLDLRLSQLFKSVRNNLIESGIKGQEQNVKVVESEDDSEKKIAIFKEKEERRSIVNLIQTNQLDQMIKRLDSTSKQTPDKANENKLDSYINLATKERMK